MKPLPMSQGRVVAKGSCEKMMLAVDSAGDAQTISSSEYREFFIPEDGTFNAAIVMVQVETLSGYDPESNHLPFFGPIKTRTQIVMLLLPTAHGQENPLEFHRKRGKVWVFLKLKRMDQK